MPYVRLLSAIEVSRIQGGRLAVLLYLHLALDIDHQTTGHQYTPEQLNYLKARIGLRQPS